MSRPQSQLHHLIPDNLARAHPFFQEAMKRGLFGLDEQTNIIEVAENAASLKTAQNLFQQGQTGTLLPPLVHRGPHPRTDQETRQIIQQVLKDNNIRDKDLPKLTDQQIRDIVEEIHERLREIYEKGKIPKKNGNQIASNPQEQHQWA